MTYKIIYKIVISDKKLKLSTINLKTPLNSKPYSLNYFTAS